MRRVIFARKRYFYKSNKKKNLLKLLLICTAIFLLFFDGAIKLMWGMVLLILLYSFLYSCKGSCKR